MKTLFRFQRTIPAIAGIVFILISLHFYENYALQKDSFFRVMDGEITNIMFRLRGVQKASDKVVIVDIDDKSLKEKGQWPWPRDMLANLVTKIHDNGAKVTGLDIFFPEKDRTSPVNIVEKLNLKNKSAKELDLPDFDIMFGDAISETNTIMGYMFTMKREEKANCCPFPSAQISIDSKNIKFSELNFKEAKNSLLNIPEVAAGISEGFLNIFPESSGVIHKVPLMLSFNKIPYPSLALELFRIFVDGKSIIITPSLTKSADSEDKYDLVGIGIKDKLIKTDINGEMYINFKGPPFSYRYISASDILDDKTEKTALKDKIVLIGTSAPGLLDIKATPFSSAFPGVEIHATIIDNMLNNDEMIYDKLTEAGVTYSFILFGGISITLMIIFSGPILASLISILSLISLFELNYYLMFLNNRIAGFSYTAVFMVFLCSTLILFNYFFKEREKKFIQNAFSHYVSPAVVNELLKSPEKLSLSGETKSISILFGDIRSFTTISESLKPYQLGELLNNYFTRISNIIIDNNGVVDKFIGDAVMAFWGAPVDNENHASDSVTASFKIFKELDKFNAEWQKKGFPLINIGIGINSGEVRVGNFGSDQRFDYTVIGDNVNLASRLEGLNKHYKTKLLITEFTNDLVKEKILTKRIDWVKVKGKTRPVSIFEPLAIMEEADKRLMEEVEEFHNFLNLYKKGDFRLAKEKIYELMHKYSAGIYQVYFERVKELEKNPPENWDGVYTFTTK